MILLRHGQSEFNARFGATRQDPGIPDPPLTPLGHEQAEAVAHELAKEGLKRIVVSPYTRALQTAAPIARHLGLPVVVNPAVRERYAFSCDVGSPRSALATAFPDRDLTTIEEIWWPQIEEPKDQVEARAALFRAEMAAIDGWRDTLVVCHWGFIMALTGLSVRNAQWLRYDPNAAAPAEVGWTY